MSGLDLKRLLAVGCACFSALGTTACDDDDDGVGVGDTSLRVLLTDAPSDYIAQAAVDIGEVELLGGPSGPIVLSFNGTDGPVNLLELRGDAAMELANADIEPGGYSEIRLEVESASVTLAEGYVFSDQSSTQELTIPAGGQQGIVLNLGPAQGRAPGEFEVESGETTLLVDFDVNQSFVLQGNPDTPAGLQGVLLLPRVRLALEDVDGSISGTVSTTVPGGSVAGLVVRAEPASPISVGEFQTLVATGVTDDFGAYTIDRVVPGGYTVTVETPDGQIVTAVDVVVADSEAATGVDFTIVAG